MTQDLSTNSYNKEKGVNRKKRFVRAMGRVEGSVAKRPVSRRGRTTWKSTP